MATEKLLSICIPTYNRATHLEKILDNLMGEIRNVRDEVEICVSDNASTDPTEDVLKRASEKIPLRYQKNEKNLGYDLNAINVTMMARGKFIWYTGDDDIFLEGSVERLVEDIKQNDGKNIGVIFINALAGNRGIVNFNFDKFRLFKVAEDALPATHSGFAGCVCLRTELAKEIIGNQILIKEGKAYKKNFNKVILQEFAHVYLCLECIKKGEYVGIEPRCGIKVVAGGSVSYTKKFYLSIVIMRYIMEIKRYYPEYREYYPWMNHLKTMLSLAGIVAEKPEFETAYRAAYRTALKVFEIESESVPSMILRAYEGIRKNSIVRFLVSTIHSTGRRTIGKQLQYTNERDESVLRNLPYVISDLDNLIGTSDPDRRASNNFSAPLC